MGVVHIGSCLFWEKSSILQIDIYADWIDNSHSLFVHYVRIEKELSFALSNQKKVVKQMNLYLSQITTSPFERVFLAKDLVFILLWSETQRNYLIYVTLINL